MPLNLLQPHVLFETFRTATSTRANGGLRAGRRFAGMVFDGMGFVTSVSEKVAKAVLATSRGFQTPWVSLQEIGAGFLATGPAKVFSFGTSMRSLCVIGFLTVGTDLTGPEKPRQTGDDIVISLLVEQDQLFVLGVSKRRDMEGPVHVDQDNLVTDEGRRSTEGRQGIVTTRTCRDASFVMELQCQCSLEWPPPLANAVPFRVFVQAGFGSDEGLGTAELIVILDPDDGF